MRKRSLIVVGVMFAVLIALTVLFTRLAAADGITGAGSQTGTESGMSADSNTSATEEPAQGRASTDPQRLMIPRWFLTSLTLDGQSIEVPEGALSLQFKEGGEANGSGGCNDFFSQYQTGADGAMQFGPIGATKMFCDTKMEAETAYFEALSRVSRFKTEDWKLFLTSDDGKTALVFGMPPK